MSIFEVERKRELNSTGDALAARLIELGYCEGGSFVEVDTYYSRPDVDYLETVECLRVRQRERDGFAEITYKPASDASTHSRDDVIAKCETNVGLSSLEQAVAANDLLVAIGMVVLARVEKSRALYRHPDRADTMISIDTVAGVGTFVETEIMAEDATKATVLLEEIERLLDLIRWPVVSLPYRDLVLQRGQLDMRATT